MGLWDMYQGFGESLEDWGAGSGNYGVGSLNPSFGESFKGLDWVGIPGPINRSAPAFTPWHKQLDYGGPPQNEAEQLYQYFLRAGKDRWGGQPAFGRSVDQMNYLGALIEAASARENNNSIPLRDAEHGLVAQVAARESPIGRYGGLFAVPAYNLAKYIAQRGPAPVGRFMDALGDRALDGGPNSLTQASPPSWKALWWGLRPWWGKD